MPPEPNPSEVFRILGARRRLAIIRILRHHGPAGANKIAEILGITPAAASQHLKALRHAGLVLAERHGYHIPYSLNEETLHECCSEVNRACGMHNGIPEEPGDDLEALLLYKAGLERKLRLIMERIEELRR
ncbi:MAG TPA: metalloregulator ArsR/SmtB family transcription factor [bacterium]|nr:metalloregulator ArsR/SmtB family transcription factor [bacterium]